MALTYADIKKWGLARLSDVAGGTAGVASFNTRTGAVTAITADLTDSTAAGRSLVTAADAAAQRTALGLGTAATQASTAFATAAQGTLAGTALQPSAALTQAAVTAATAAGVALLDAANAAAQKAALGITQADVASNAPVPLTGATSLTAATHGNRQITFTGASATLTVLNDASGGWASDEEIIVQTLAGSTGVPTLSTPDSKTVTGSVNQPVGAKRKGANSWDVYLLPQSVGGGGGASGAIVSGWDVHGMVSPAWTQAAVTTVGFQTSAASSGTASAQSSGATAYLQHKRTRYTGTAGANQGAGLHTNIQFALGLKHTHRASIFFGVADALGAGSKMFAGWGSTSMLGFAAQEPADDFLGFRIGVGYRSTDTGNLRLIVAPLSGVGTTTDLGASFPIPTAAETVLYRLDLQYFPSSDAGGRRIVWTLTETISGATATGTQTASLPSETDAGIYAMGVRRVTGAGGGTAIVDFAGVYAGHFLKYVS